MKPIPEEYFAVGTNVRATPRDEEGAIPSPGTIIHIRELADHMEYFVRFNPPKDPRLNDWYRYDDLQFVSAVSGGFKQPKIHEVRNIERIEIGGFQLRTWYFSPYPAPFNQVERLFICERCLRYARKEEVYREHCRKCRFTVPGFRIYDDGIVTVYEVDGRAEKLFCQFLCLFSKLFLDGKTLYYNTELFLFYVMTSREATLQHDLNLPAPSREEAHQESIVGYFSKEKLSSNVLSCILTFPMYQRLGIGLLLSDFAYILARIENRVGGPEEPLSDLGEQAFKSYWRRRVAKLIIQRGEETFGKFQTLQEVQSLHTPKLSACSTMYDSAIPEPCQTEEPVSSSKHSTEPVSMHKKAAKQIEIEIEIADISQETGIIGRHVRLALDMLKAKFRKDAIVVTKQFYEECCRQVQAQDQRRALKGGIISRHELDVAHLVWEPYPAMFQQMTDGPQEDGTQE